MDIADIKKLRNKLGLTQAQLAKYANVSQSLIAKIEAQTIDPAYSKVTQILQCLDELKKKHQIKAKDLVTRKLISITTKNSLKEAINKMKKYGFSQIPVMKDHTVVGVVSETAILEAIIENKGHSISNIMLEAPPLVSNEASLTVVSQLLKHYPMVLVSANGKVIGLITKSNIIDKVNL